MFFIPNLATSIARALASNGENMSHTFSLTAKARAAIEENRCAHCKGSGSILDTGADVVTKGGTQIRVTTYRACTPCQGAGVT